MKKITNESLEAVHTHTHTHTHTGSLKENKKKNIKGITLVALVVTIIILLILAGISISALTQTGLFGKAKQAEQKSKDVQELENLTLADYENSINKIIDGTTREDSNNKGKILWKNNNFDQEFAEQTVELSDKLEDYNYIKIFFKSTNDNRNDIVDNQSFSVESLVIDNKISTTLEFSWYAEGWAGHPLMYRRANGENNKVYFNNGYTSGNGSNNVVSNLVVIPCYIIGYKF